MQNSVSSKIHNFTAGVMQIMASVGWAFDFVNNPPPNSSSKGAANTRISCLLLLLLLL
jgi:hypothetical protein